MQEHSDGLAAHPRDHLPLHSLLGDQAHRPAGGAGRGCAHTIAMTPAKGPGQPSSRTPGARSVRTSSTRYHCCRSQSHVGPLRVIGTKIGAASGIPAWRPGRWVLPWLPHERRRGPGPSVSRPESHPGSASAKLATTPDDRRWPQTRSRCRDALTATFPACTHQRDGRPRCIEGDQATRGRPPAVRVAPAVRGPC